MLTLEHKRPTLRGRSVTLPTQHHHNLPQSASRAVQRAPSCVCGGSCPRCQAKSTLKIGAPDDAYEREADAVADRVMRMSGDADSVTPSSPGLQRKCAACKKEDEEQLLQPKAESSSVSAQGNLATAPASVHGVLNSPGQPLATDIRAFFDTRFGHDFSGVRVHSDTAAALSARDVNAHAYTVGHHIVFGASRFAPGTNEGKRLLAHELTHVMQQRGAVPRPMRRPSTAFQRTSVQASAQVSHVIQRAGDPAALIGLGLRCPTDLTAGRPVGTDVLFPVSGSVITPVHTTALTTFRGTWLAAGGTDDILVHGYASTEGEQGPNWTLSCDRAEAVQAELVRLGIPAVHISVVAHGESTDFGSSTASNQHAVVSTSSPGIMPLPIVRGLLTARDNFASRSVTRFGVGEIIDLSFFSFPLRPASDFGGLEWHLVSGGGALTLGTNLGTATYTAPAAAGAVQLELQVATGATAGRVISTHAITIVTPSGVRMTEVPGTAPDFAGAIAAGTWGAGFLANPFIDPRDVSFQGVTFGEGTVAGVVTPPGSFLSPFAARIHLVGGLVPGGGGNAATGTPVLGVDSITQSGVPPTHAVLGMSICGASDFLWAIPWDFSVAGGPRTPFTTANHHATSTLLCNATIEKAGAGPFCRRIDGTTC